MKRNIVNLRRLFLIFFISITIEVYSYHWQLIAKEKDCAYAQSFNTQHYRVITLSALCMHSLMSYILETLPVISLSAMP